MTLRTDGTACTYKSGLITGAMSAWYVRVFSCKECKSIFGVKCKVLVCMQPISEYTLCLQGLILHYVSIPQSRLVRAAFAKEVGSMHAIARSSAAVSALHCSQKCSVCCCTCVSHGCVIVRLQPSCSSDVLKSVFVLQVFEKLGLSLYDFLRVNQYRPFRIDVVRDFGRQLLESVAYLHGLDLIHTDLKPENILLAACDDDRKSPTPGIRSATLAPFLFFFSCWLCALLPLLLLPLLLFFPCALSTQILQQILLTACGKWRTLLRPDVVMTITGFPPLLQQSGDSPVK